MNNINISGNFYYKSKDLEEFLGINSSEFTRLIEKDVFSSVKIGDVTLYCVQDNKFKRKTKEKSKGSQFFEAYSKAYKKRYGVEPVRNMKQNALSFQITTRLGLEDSLQLAEFYLNHDDTFYVKNLHPLGLLLNSCESLVTQMKSGYKMNNVIAKKEEKRLSFNSDKEEIEKYFNDKRGSN